jgi:hypothetical protein
MICYFLFILEFLCFFYTWLEGDKLYYLESDSDISSEENKLVKSLHLLTWQQTSLQNNNKTYRRENKRRMKILYIKALMLDICLIPLA